MQIEHITPEQWLGLAVLLGGAIGALYWVRHWYRYFFDRQTVWNRKFDTHAYEAKKQLRYKAWRGINSVRGERRRLSEAEQQDVRNKAHRSL